MAKENQEFPIQYAKGLMEDLDILLETCEKKSVEQYLHYS
jgi:hypothetical protein